MRLLYVKSELRDLSQGSRIAFVRELRHLSQDKISEHLGLTGNVKNVLTDKIIFETSYPEHYFYIIFIIVFIANNLFVIYNISVLNSLPDICMTI